MLVNWIKFNLFKTLVEVQLHENKGQLYNPTEDMQMATDSYLSWHQHYILIWELLGLWIWPDGVCILHNLW